MTSLDRWYEEAFRSDYRRVYAHRDLAGARAEVDFLLRRGLSGRVLDLCCGFGRHTLAMRERGLCAFGLDLSMDLLRESRGLERAELLAGRLVRGDAASLPFADQSFDCVANLFSSFGYFGELGDLAMLAEIARVVAPRGRVFLDLMNPSFVRSRLQPETSREGRDFLVRETRALLEGGRRVVKDVELRLDDGAVRRWREDVRLYEAEEMRALLADRGLSIEGLFGDFDGRPHGPDTPRLLVAARR